MDNYTDPEFCPIQMVYAGVNKTETYFLFISYLSLNFICVVHNKSLIINFRSLLSLFRQTLLHEMIHALLFVTQNNRDRDGHGPEFCKHMNRINKASGTKITVSV